MHICTGMAIEYEGNQDSANSEDDKCFTVSPFVFLHLERTVFYPYKRINSFVKPQRNFNKLYISVHYSTFKHENFSSFMSETSKQIV